MGLKTSKNERERDRGSERRRGDTFYADHGVHVISVIHVFSYIIMNNKELNRQLPCSTPKTIKCIYWNN